MPVTFEKFQEVLETVYSAVIEKCLQDARESSLWQSAELYWLGFVHEQDKFYVSVSMGRLKSSNSKDKSRPFDYLESYKINGENFPRLKVERLNDAFDDLLNPGLKVKAADLDEDELDEAKGSLRTFAALVVLASFARKIEADRAMFGPRHSSFLCNVSGDIESPLWPAAVESLDFEPEVVEAALSAMTEKKATRDLFKRLFQAAGKRRPPSIQELL